jgi:sugar O-acyltransferase (sialic acid O-acetyltransferase NeuD family)
MRGNCPEFVIWGAKGHALVLADIIHGQGGRVIALFDREPPAISPLVGVPVYAGLDDYHAWVRSLASVRDVAAIAAIGGARGKDRCDYLALFRHTGFRTPFLIHPSATVSPSARIGDNCQVLAGTVVVAGAQIGEASIINTKASVDHECVLGEGVHIAPGATLCGCVEIGSFTLVGAGAVVLPRVRIGTNVLVGAGSAVTKDIPDNVVAVGVPARVVRKNPANHQHQSCVKPEQQTYDDTSRAV